MVLKDTRLDTGSPELAGNNLLSGASLSQDGNNTVLTLDLRRAGHFGLPGLLRRRQPCVPVQPDPLRAFGAKIYIDPGHGGYDGGTSIAGMYTEKSMNADLASRVASILRGPGRQRTGDRHVRLCFAGCAGEPVPELQPAFVCEPPPQFRRFQCQRHRGVLFQPLLPAVGKQSFRQGGGRWEPVTGAQNTAHTG